MKKKVASNSRVLSMEYPRLKSINFSWLKHESLQNWSLISPYLPEQQRVIIMIWIFFCVFQYIVVFKIWNHRPQRLTSSPWPIFYALKIPFGGPKVSPFSARPKRSCYIVVTQKTVKTRRQLWWIKEVTDSRALTKGTFAALSTK